MKSDDYDSTNVENNTGHESFEEDDECGYEEYYLSLKTSIPLAEKLGDKIANFLENLVDSNEKCMSRASVFDLEKLASISIKAYVNRIIQYSHNSAESLIIALILIEKYIQNKENITINRRNIYK